MNEVGNEKLVKENVIISEKVNFFDFKLSGNALDVLRDSLPSTVNIASIGCGTLPNEPAQLANLFDRDVNYTGYDNDEDVIAKTQEMLKDGTYAQIYKKRTKHKVTARFAQDDLTRNKEREKVEAVVFNLPDVLGSQEDDWLEKVGEPSEAWIEIFHNSLQMLGKNGKVIVICFSEDEDVLIREYLQKDGVNVSHSNINKEGMILLIGSR